ncbi:MATH and LRR domain-containing protein PFE0570w isoform X2 [Hydra vulgaris]|uniref:MATH and LRR domain-containing protein PFE0570w isoform X2 n=1 Tax=Hydra vulgaris TaxID=6087 RepID=A0ABM4D898_HYDVU
MRYKRRCYTLHIILYIMTITLTVTSFLSNKSSNTFFTEADEPLSNPLLKKSISKLNKSFKIKINDRQPILDLSVRSFLNANRNLPRRKRKRNNVPQKVKDINNSETRILKDQTYFGNYVSNGRLLDTLVPNKGLLDTTLNTYTLMQKDDLLDSSKAKTEMFNPSVRKLENKEIDLYGSQINPAKSCRDVFLTKKDALSGNYWIKTEDGELLMVACGFPLKVQTRTQSDNDKNKNSIGEIKLQENGKKMSESANSLISLEKTLELTKSSLKDEENVKLKTSNINKNSQSFLKLENYNQPQLKTNELYIRNSSPDSQVPSNSMQKDNPNNIDVVPTKSSKFTIPGRKTETKKTTIITLPTIVTTTIKSETTTKKTNPTTVTIPTMTTTITTPTTNKITQTTSAPPTTIPIPTTVPTTTTKAITVTRTTTTKTIKPPIETPPPLQTPPPLISPPPIARVVNNINTLTVTKPQSTAFNLPINMLSDEKSVDKIYKTRNSLINSKLENPKLESEMNLKVQKVLRKGYKNGNAGDLGDIQDEIPPETGTDMGVKLQAVGTPQNTPEQTMKVNYKVAQEFETQPQVRSWAFRENNMLQNHAFDEQYNSIDVSEKKKNKNDQKPKIRSWTSNQIDMQKNLTKDQYNNFEKNDQEIAENTFKEQYKEFEHLKKSLKDFKGNSQKDVLSLPITNDQETSLSSLTNNEEKEKLIQSKPPMIDKSEKEKEKENLSQNMIDESENDVFRHNKDEKSQKITENLNGDVSVLNNNFQGGNNVNDNSLNDFKLNKESTSEKNGNALTTYSKKDDNKEDKFTKAFKQNSFLNDPSLVKNDFSNLVNIGNITDEAKPTDRMSLMIKSNPQSEEAFIKNLSHPINTDNQITSENDEMVFNNLIAKKKETQTAIKRGKEAYLKGDEFVLDSENDEALNRFFKNKSFQNGKNERETDKKFDVFKPIKLKQISGPPNPIVLEKEEHSGSYNQQSSKLRYLGVLNDEPERLDKKKEQLKDESKLKDQKLFLYKKLRGDGDENSEAKPSNIYVDNRVFIYGGIKGGKEILPTVLNTVIKKDKGGEEEIQRRIKLRDFSEADAVIDSSPKSFIKKKGENSITFEIDDATNKDLKEIDQDKPINQKDSSSIFIEKNIDFENEKQEKIGGTNPVIRQLTSNYVSNSNKENEQPSFSQKDLEQIKRVQLIKAQAHNAEDVLTGKFSTSNLKHFLYKNGSAESDFIDSYGFVRDGTGGAHRIFGTNDIKKQVKQTNIRPIQSSLNVDKNLAKVQVTKSFKNKFDSFSGELGEEQQPFREHFTRNKLNVNPSLEAEKKIKVKTSDYVSPINQEQLPGASDRLDFLDMTSIYEPLKTMSHSLSGLLSEAQKNMSNIPGYSQDNKKMDEEVRKNADKIVTQTTELLHHDSIRQKIEQPESHHILNEATSPIMDKRWEIKSPYVIKNAPTTGADKRTELIEVEEEFAKEESKPPSTDPVLQKIINHMKSGFAIKTSSYTKGADDKRTKIFYNADNKRKQISNNANAKRTKIPFKWPQPVNTYVKNQNEHAINRIRKEISEVNSLCKRISNENFNKSLKVEVLNIFNMSKIENCKNFEEKDFAPDKRPSSAITNANIFQMFSQNSKKNFQSTNKTSLNNNLLLANDNPISNKTKLSENMTLNNVMSTSKNMLYDQTNFLNALDLKRIVTPAFTTYTAYVKSHDLKQELFNGIFPEPQVQISENLNKTIEGNKFNHLDFGSRPRKFKSSILGKSNILRLKADTYLKRRKREINTKIVPKRIRALIPSKVGRLQPSNLKPMPPVGHDPDDSGSKNSLITDVETPNRNKKVKSKVSSENEVNKQITNAKTKKSEDEDNNTLKAKDEDGVQDLKDDQDSVELRKISKENESETQRVDTTFEAGLKESDKNEQKVKNNVDNDGINFDLGAQRNASEKQKSEEDSAYGNITIFNYPINVTALEEGIMKLINQTTPSPKVYKGKEQDDYVKKIEAQNKKYPELKLPQKHGEYIPPDDDEYDQRPTQKPKLDKPKMVSKYKKPKNELTKEEEKSVAKETEKAVANQPNNQSKNGSENEDNLSSYNPPLPPLKTNIREDKTGKDLKIPNIIDTTPTESSPHSLLEVAKSTREANNSELFKLTLKEGKIKIEKLKSEESATFLKQVNLGDASNSSKQNNSDSSKNNSIAFSTLSNQNISLTNMQNINKTFEEKIPKSYDLEKITNATGNPIKNTNTTTSHLSHANQTGNQQVESIKLLEGKNESKINQSLEPLKQILNKNETSLSNSTANETKNQEVLANKTQSKHIQQWQLNPAELSTSGIAPFPIDANNAIPLIPIPVDSPLGKLLYPALNIPANNQIRMFHRLIKLNNNLSTNSPLLEPEKKIIGAPIELSETKRVEDTMKLFNRQNLKPNDFTTLFQVSKDQTFSNLDTETKNKLTSMITPDKRGSVSINKTTALISGSNDVIIDIPIFKASELQTLLSVPYKNSFDPMPGSAVHIELENKNGRFVMVPDALNFAQTLPQNIKLYSQYKIPKIQKKSLIRNENRRHHSNKATKINNNLQSRNILYRNKNLHKKQTLNLT